MTTAEKYARPSSVVVTVPDPDTTAVASYAEKGGTLQWRTDTHNYPEFEIQFIGPNPCNDNADDVFRGSDLEPVVMRLDLDMIGEEYQYMVRHFHKDGTSKDTGPFLLRVTPCRGCPP
jgi:hypothetical protein